MPMPNPATITRSKEEAIQEYEALITETPIKGRPWLRLTFKSDDRREVEVPKFAGHIVRRVIRVLFLGSDEGP